MYLNIFTFFWCLDKKMKKELLYIFANILLNCGSHQIDVYDEELFIKQLQTGHVYSLFQFTTTWDVNIFEQKMRKIFNYCLVVHFTFLYLWTNCSSNFNLLCLSYFSFALQFFPKVLWWDFIQIWHCGDAFHYDSGKMAIQQMGLSSDYSSDWNWIMGLVSSRPQYDKVCIFFIFFCYCSLKHVGIVPKWNNKTLFQNEQNK